VSTDAAARVSATANAAVPLGTYTLSHGRAGALSSNAGVSDAAARVSATANPILPVGTRGLSHAATRVSATANTAMPVGTLALCNAAGGLPPNRGLPHAGGSVSNAHGDTAVHDDTNLSVGAHTLSISAGLS
jgi:hypothetical protein